MKRFIALATVLTLCFAVSAEVGDNVEDAAVTARIETTFLLNQHLNPFDINTTTQDGIVTLTGGVHDEIQRELAEELARSAKGAKDVINNILVVPTAIGDKERRSFSQKVKDRTTEAAVRSRLLYHNQFNGLKVGVDSVNNVATLHGVVPTETVRLEAAQVAESTKGVDRVINNLTVRPKDPAAPVQKIGRVFSDEWMESRVETAILINRHLSIRELDVEVDDGVCILTGAVDSDAERKLAEEIAGSIQGINNVRNEITLRVSGAIVPAPAGSASTGMVVLDDIDPQDEPVPSSAPAVEERALESPGN